MSEDFKEKLKAYKEGSLTDEERKEVEAELDKIELYQMYMDELTGEDKQDIPDESEKKIIRRGKWRARFHNALTVIGIFIIVSIVSSVLTNLFYYVGKPNKMELYRDVVRSTIAVTEPNLRLASGGSSQGTFFTMNIKGELVKKVGNNDISKGDINVNFLFNKCGYPEWNWVDGGNNVIYVFKYPGGEPRSHNEDEWIRLDKLPEGTVAEAYIFLDKFYDTDEILKKFEKLNMEPLWFAVDTGKDEIDKFSYPLGFPYNPIWHYEDMKEINVSTKKESAFIKSTTKTMEAPPLDDYGSGDLRNKNFISTLNLLKKYEKTARSISRYPLKLQQKLDYINKNGVRIYGAVVTGPTKEILKLKKENWVSEIQVGDVELWNWNERK